MGQAKRRGTYEERKTNAIEDNKRTIKLLEEQRAAWWNSLSDKEQEGVTERRMKNLKAMEAISRWTAAASGGYRMSQFPNISLLSGSGAL